MKVPLLGSLFTPKRKQEVLILTEDGRIVGETLEVETGYAVNRKTQEAWALDSENQIESRASGEVLQVLTERDVAPLVLNGKTNVKITKAIINKVAEEKVDQEIIKVEKQAAKNKVVMGLMAISIIFAILVVTIILTGLFQSGKVKLPF